MRGASLRTLPWLISLSGIVAHAAVWSTPEEEYNALLEKHDAAWKVFLTDVQKSMTPEDREALIQEEQPDDDQFAAQFLALAEKAPESEVAVESLIWIIRHADPLLAPGKGIYKRAVGLLLRDHSASERLAECAVALGRGREGRAGPAITRSQETLLRGLMEKSPHRMVRGLACLALAEGRDYLSKTILNTRDAEPSQRKALEELAGKEFIADLLRRDPAQLTKEAERLFERVEEEFGDIETVRQGENVTLDVLARRSLFELRNLAVGSKAPEIESVGLDGKTVRLSDLRGKVVVLDIWATWCLPCRKMIPHLRRLVQRLEGKPFVLVSINVDAEMKTLKEFLQAEPMPWTHWYNGDEGGILDAWNIRGFPTVFVLDPGGVVRYRSVHDEALDKAVDELLTEAERQK